MSVSINNTDINTRAFGSIYWSSNIYVSGIDHIESQTHCYDDDGSGHNWRMDTYNVYLTGYSGYNYVEFLVELLEDDTTVIDSDTFFDSISGGTTVGNTFRFYVSEFQVGHTYRYRFTSTFSN